MNGCREYLHGVWLQLLQAYLELGKARLTAMTVASAAAGFVLAGVEPFDWTALAWLIAGAGLAGLGANGLNQCIEAPNDARMQRTLGRPVAAGRISRRQASGLSLALATAGVCLLAATVNPLAAALAAGTVLLYVLIYTPLKQRDPVCTLIGAVVGGLPPIMGWAASGRPIGAAGLVLGAILFVWQIPHSLALAWQYRDDYALGGYKVLGRDDPAGRRTFHMIVLYSLCLLPVSLTLYLTGQTGHWYALGATALGVCLAVLAMRLWRSGRDTEARALFVATVIYLPVLLGLIVLDRT